MSHLHLLSNHIKHRLDVLTVFLYDLFFRYEEAREEEKLRNQYPDFSDMVAEEVCISYLLTLRNNIILENDN